MDSLEGQNESTPKSYPIGGLAVTDDKAVTARNPNFVAMRR